MRKKALPVYDIDNFSFGGDENDFYINKFSTHLSQYKHAVFAPHGHSFYVSLLFTKGSGMHEIDFNVYKVKPGIAHVLSPGQVHNWKLSDDIEGYVIFHTADFYNLNYVNEKLENFPFFSCTQNSPVITIPHDYCGKLENFFKEISGDYHSDKLMKYQKICSMLNVLYIELSRLYLSPGVMVKQNHSNLRKFKKLEGLINSHYKKIKYPSDYAEMMHMSAKNLNRISKLSLNKTITELIAARIVLEAKRMLMHSTHTVSQIADELGYYENSYFFRMFKKNTGQTPLEFLKKFRKN